MGVVNFQIWRGDASGGKMESYTAEVAEGMVVLDAVHQIQARQGFKQDPIVRHRQTVE